MTKEQIRTVAESILSLDQRVRENSEGAQTVTASEIVKLFQIVQRLHSLDEAACNYGLTARQETRKANLEKQAEAIAAGWGAQAYHQGDPRGCSLYIVFPGNVPEGEDIDAWYTNGVAIAV